jgi:hypothetical protein
MGNHVFEWKPYLLFGAIFLGLGLTVVAGAKIFGFI